MSFVIYPGFAPQIKENPYKELYKKDYISRSIENLIKLVEEKKEGIKCRLVRKTSATGEYTAELIVVECTDYTTFPISEVSIPIIWEQELSEMCGCNTVSIAKEYLGSRESSLVDLIFEWIRCEKCKTETLWRIIESFGLNKVITFNQVMELFEIDITKL
jgi:hypothetical protein